MKYRLVGVLFALAALVSGGMPVAAATTTYISPGANVQSALNALRPGDTLYFRSGVYQLTKVLNADVKATQANPITLTGDVGAVLDGKNGTQHIMRVHSDWYTVSNLEMRNAGYGLDFYGSHNTAANLKLHDFHSGNSTSFALHLNPLTHGGPCTANVFRDSEIYDSGGEGLYLGHADKTRAEMESCNDNEVTGLYVHNVTTDGVEVKPYSMNNLVHDNRLGPAETCIRMDKTTVQTNNTFTGCGTNVVVNKRRFG